MGKFFNNQGMVKIASTPAHYAIYDDEKEYQKGTRAFYDKVHKGAPAKAEQETKHYIKTNPFLKGPDPKHKAYSDKTGRDKYTKDVEKYTLPAYPNTKAGQKAKTLREERYYKFNPWLTSDHPVAGSGVADSKEYRNKESYASEITKYYSKRGSMAPGTQSASFVASNQWDDTHMKQEERDSIQPDDAKREAEERREERRMKGPYEGASKDDVYRSVRKQRMARMFKKLRKTVGKKRAKDISNRSDMIARERKDLFNTETDRMDQGDPNSVVSTVYEVPESQARYEAGAMDFKNRLETLKISHFPSGGSGKPDLD